MDYTTLQMDLVSSYYYYSFFWLEGTLGDKTESFGVGDDCICARLL